MGIPTPVPPSDQQKSALVEQIIRGELTPEQAQQRYGLTRAELKDWVRIYRREARRAFDDRVKSVLSSTGIRGPASSSFPLRNRPPGRAFGSSAAPTSMLPT